MANLVLNGRSIDTIDEIAENFVEEDVLREFKSGSLSAWLEEYDYSDELERVKNIKPTASNARIVTSIADALNLDDDVIAENAARREEHQRKEEEERKVREEKRNEENASQIARLLPEENDRNVDTHDKVQLWEGGPYWATMNIGAEKPEDYGYYFWWGDTVGYKRESDKWVASDGSNSNFSFDASNTPTYCKSIQTLQSEGWIISKDDHLILAPEYDAAQKHWGGDWRMPTQQELEDLDSKCDWTWGLMNGVTGYIIRGRGDYASNSIFLPCAGYGDETSLDDAGSDSYYWSSVPYSDSYDDSACGLYFDSGEHDAKYNYNYYRSDGQSVRPVYCGKDETTPARLAQNKVEGDGIKEEETEIGRLLREAENGNVKAQCTLAECYLNGNGVSENAHEAVKWLRKAAEQGNAVAQCNLGVCYLRGNGVSENASEAVKWYRKAAEQGLKDAQLFLGDCYLNGNGVSENAQEAVKWFRKAAEQGQGDAQYFLGNCYLNGNGVSENVQEAVKWYREAAKHGNAPAQCIIGRCYLDGTVVSENAHEAVEWFRKAADQGEASAQNMLGMCYLNGNGIAEDENKAFSWCMKAAQQEFPVAMYNIGSFFENGQGYNCDYEKARYWYKKAKNAGVEEAEAALERISCKDVSPSGVDPRILQAAKNAQAKSGIRKFIDEINEGIDNFFDNLF